MSSPVGHSLSGYLIYFFSSGTLKFTDFKKLILCIFIANAPDLDFIPGLILGRPNLFHHGTSHSIGAAVIFSCFLAITFNYLSRENYWKTLCLSLILYCSHLLLDYVSFDSRPPIGIPILWPLSSAYYISPFPVLPPIHHSNLTHAGTALFLKGVFSWHNFGVILLEAIVLIPFTFIIHLIRKKTRLNWNSNSHLCL